MRLTVQFSNELLKDSVATPCRAKSKRSIHIQRYSIMLRNLKTPLNIMGVLSFVLLAAPFIKPDAALAGGFSRTCRSVLIRVQNDGVWLKAVCAQTDGALIASNLRISDHIANRNGVLAWGGEGFHRSCRVIRQRGTALTAFCANGRGGMRNTALELDSKISNQDGVLAVDR